MFLECGYKDSYDVYGDARDYVQNYSPASKQVPSPSKYRKPCHEEWKVLGVTASQSMPLALTMDAEGTASMNLGFMDYGLGMGI